MYDISPYTVNRRKFMSKVVIFSLDYDGCSDILFKEYKACYDYYQADPANRPEYREAAMLFLLQEKLAEFLKEKAKEAKEVEGYIGSNRQSPALDKLNASNNQNGLAFTNLRQFYENNGWTFRSLLLADVEHHLRPGSVFKNQRLCSCNTHAHFDRDKIQIIENQLLDAAKNYPDDEVHFYFLDDDQDKKMLPRLKAYFEKEKNREKFKHIHLHFYGFDYFEAVKENKETLIEIAHIPGKQEVAANTRVSSGVTLLFPAVPANGSSVQVQSSGTTPTDTVTPTPTLSAASKQPLVSS